MSDECIAYVSGGVTCKNGFVQTLGCWKSPACWTCGEIKAKNLPYIRAAELMDAMEKNGVVTAPNHVGKREVLP